HPATKPSRNAVMFFMAGPATQVLTDRGPARTAVWKRRGRRRTRYKGGPPCARSWTVMVDDCLMRSQLPQAEHQWEELRRGSQRPVIARHLEARHGRQT